MGRAPGKGSVPLRPQLEEEAELWAAKGVSQLSLKSQAAMAWQGAEGWAGSPLWVGGEGGEGLPREEQSHPVSPQPDPRTLRDAGRRCWTVLVPGKGVSFQKATLGLPAPFPQLPHPPPALSAP